MSSTSGAAAGAGCIRAGWESGPHNLPWSGDDERGRPVAAGVYVVRVEGAGWAQSTRVTLVR
ncbi:MAG: hypothetical protein IPO18_09345 [bacterium]|nr:hypothetical protein [bacterium]